MNALSRILTRLTTTLRPPAGAGLPPVPEARPPVRAPLPGLDWTHDTRYREAQCGCFEVVNYLHNRRHRKLCHRHAFEAHWEARLND